MKITSLEGVNAVDFVRQAFDLFEKQEVFAVLRPDVDLDRYGQFEIGRSLSVTPGLGWGKFEHRISFSDAPAQIIFSSGTEGQPKPIVLSHRNLGDTVQRLHDITAPTSEIREYIGVPVTYAFGFGRTRLVSAAGGAFFLPERFDPSEIRTLLDTDQINAISAVPSLWRILLSQPHVIGQAGEKVRWIEIGSQYMSRDEKTAMKTLFPNANILFQYGLTEASRTTFLTISKEIGTALDSVGYVTGSAEIEIDAHGAIRIRGDHIASGILDTDGTIQTLTDADGWLTTKDRGEIGTDGALRYLGRLDDQINIAGFKLASETLEQEINDLINLQNTFAIVAIPDPVRGDTVLLAVTDALGDRAPLVEAAARIVMQRRNLPHSNTLPTLQVEALPRTDTGKVRRQALREAYLSDIATNEAPMKHPAGGTRAAWQDRLFGRRKTVPQVFQDHFADSHLPQDATFRALGGDSLSHMSLALRLETILGDLPADWADMTIAELADREPVKRWYGLIETQTLLRAIAIALIVAGHFDFFHAAGGAAYTLFVVAGVSFAAFTWPQIENTGSSRPIASLLFRVVILALGYMLLRYTATGYGEWPAFLFIDNWVSPTVAGGVWFISVYLQIFCILLVAFSATGTRRIFSQQPFVTAAIAMGTFVVVAAVSDALYDTHHLFRRLPHLVAWMFLTGVAIAFAKTRAQKLIVTLLFLAGYWQFLEFGVPEFEFFPLSIPILIWISHIPLPRLLLKPLHLLAASTLVIYLTHTQIGSVVEKILPDSSAISWLAALAAGVFIWWIYNPIDMWIARRLGKPRPGKRA